MRRLIPPVCVSQPPPAVIPGWQCIEEYKNNVLQTTKVYGNNIDELLLVIDEVNEEEYYYHTNVQGSVVAISDDTGAVRETFAYDIYGRLTAATAWNGSSSEAVVDGDLDGDGQSDEAADGFFDKEYFATSVIDNETLFQGRRYDRESGLYYFRHRQYDPQHGCFLTRDPMGYRDSHNLYQFVNNNPVCYIDPYGMEEENSGAGGGTPACCPCVEEPEKCEIVLKWRTDPTYELTYSADFGYWLKFGVAAEIFLKHKDGKNVKAACHLRQGVEVYTRSPCMGSDTLKEKGMEGTVYGGFYEKDDNDYSYEKYGKTGNTYYNGWSLVDTPLIRSSNTAKYDSTYEGFDNFSATWFQAHVTLDGVNPSTLELWWGYAAGGYLSKNKKPHVRGERWSGEKRWPYYIILEEEYLQEQQFPYYIK